ncbi:hypothetical protein EGK75_04290 [Neisseria weixii]|uniref:Uncharacterized protein n=1 Tax=Neisseria weixii TaxID=1853276 RepID=A0A3N4N1C6_9NEIS|nr:DUF6685 family protein [Neisseria weixii]RPD89135.1 hypothetical protein EGK74_04565 [Neisseria weixii]RPD89667.1 hypothetical protein EGK75_04290 [Neisseria weixii]
MFYSILNKIQLLRLNISIRKFINQNELFIVNSLKEPQKSIALSSVIRWHDWQDIDSYYFHHPYGAAKGWVYEDHRYQFRELRLDEFKFFGICEIIGNWECELQDVTGLAASKSELRDFFSLDELVENNSKEMIFPISHEKLEQNLNWREIRIFHKNSSDYFATYVWDKRLFLINAGGSHHFSAARYLAKKLNKKIFLKGKLHSYKINENSVYSLIQKFEMFIVSNHYSFTNEFREIMETFKADYFMRYLPEPYKENYCVLLLPRINRRSLQVAEVLKLNNTLDFSVFLKELLKIQNSKW